MPVEPNIGQRVFHSMYGYCTMNAIFRMHGKPTYAVAKDNDGEWARGPITEFEVAATVPSKRLPRTVR